VATRARRWVRRSIFGRREPGQACPGAIAPRRRQPDRRPLAPRPCGADGCQRPHPAESAEPPELNLALGVGGVRLAPVELAALPLLPPAFGPGSGAGSGGHRLPGRRRIAEQAGGPVAAKPNRQPVRARTRPPGFIFCTWVQARTTPARLLRSVMPMASSPGLRRSDQPAPRVGGAPQEGEVGGGLELA